MDVGGKGGCGGGKEDVGGKEGRGGVKGVTVGKENSVMMNVRECTKKKEGITDKTESERKVLKRQNKDLNETVNDVETLYQNISK